MRTSLTTTLLFALTVFVASAQANNSNSLSFGETIPNIEPTSLETFFENPESYIGKNILIEGIVTNSCERMGCWMSLKTTADHELFRIKVNDGEMVFPIAARGKTAWAYGAIEIVDLAPEEGSENPRTLFQLRPTGVRVAGE